MPDTPDLDAIFAQMDALGIAPLAEEKKREPITADTRLRESFREITAFVEKNGREPRKLPTNIKELELAARLADFRENPEKMKAVLDIDPLNLLPHEDVSVEDIMTAMQSAAPDVDIFDMSGLPTPRHKPEYIASRKPCTDFEQYRQLFAQCQDDLWQGRRHIVRVAGHEGAIQNFGIGRFVVVRGVLGYVADAETNTSMQSWQVNRRLRVIFENGTESDLLLRSLFRAMYENGCLISERDEDVLDGMQLGDNESECGIIYILKSLNPNKQIQEIPNLYKIGVTTKTLEERIANAENEPTYLMDKVVPVQTFHCYNMNVEKFEHLIHRAFADAQVDLEIVDANGCVCRPREWFSVPISVVQQAVQMIIDGSIVGYKYDVSTRRMVARAEE